MTEVIDERTTDIEALKTEIYPKRKAVAVNVAQIYGPQLEHLINQADQDAEGSVCIPVGMAVAILDICAFVERLEMYGK